MVEGIYRLFDSIWRLSLVGSYCILLVILARFLLKKAPKWCSYLLWGIVFVRLCCPVLPGTRISLIPERLLTVGAATSAQLTAGNSAGSVDNEGVYNGSYYGDNTVDAVLSGADNTENRNVGTLGASGNGEGSVPASGQDGNEGGASGIGADGTGGIRAPDNSTNASDAGYPADDRDNADGSLQTFRVLSIVWLLGMAGFVGYHAFSYLRMRNRLHRPDSGVRQVEPGICEIDGGHLSFVMGLIHPVIYLSSGLDPESRKVVLCHERVHLQRRDYLFKPAALLICCVHWFNPLVWLAFYLMNMDCEMSCDEKVVKLLGEESKKIYSYTLLEEASGGEWKRYRGGSICTLLSFGEDHVKNRIRHVLDYHKPPFWVMIGAAVIVVLVMCLCSNPGGSGNGADTANVSDVSDATEEVTTGELTEDGSDDEGRKTEWLATLEQGIHSREEFSALFDVDTLEDTRSFAGQDGIGYLEYNGVAARKMHRQILDGDTAAHETYKDPVKAAEALLHLEGGSGEMTELLYEAERQYLFFQKDSTRPGEGSVANVHYIFADGSAIDIPMVFAEESSQIWLLSLGDIDSKGRHSYGPLDGENQARIVYAEYGLQGEEENPLAGVYGGEYTQVPQGSFADKYADYQVSSYGIYVVDGTELDCVVPGYIAPGYATSDWTCIYQDRRLFATSDQCDRIDDYREVIESMRLYYLASSDYQDGDLDIWIDTIREYDTSEQSGENGTSDWKLSSAAQDFDKAALHAEDGYWIFDNSDGSEQLKLPLLSARPVWNGKTAAELTAEETDAYAAAQRQEILTKVGVVYDVSERAAQETYALLDLDGDGTADRITLRSRMAQALNAPDHSPLDQYAFTVNTTSGEMRTAQNLGNSIYAFSPDGRQILLALTGKDEQGQYESFLFRYQNGEVQEVGSFAQDIRKIWVQNGQIITTQNYDYTLQREKLHIVYCIGSDGRLEEVPAERYELPN